MKRIWILTVVMIITCLGLFAQDNDTVQVNDYIQDDDTGQIMIDGELVPYMVVEGDTLLMADLEGFSVSSPRTFKDRNERRKFLKYKRYANVVYPYAVEAIKIFRESEEATRTMKSRKKKKYMKKLQKDLETELKEPLIKLTKTQGYILIKMIEKELDTPFYDLVKNLRGGFVAGYWNQLGRLNGYRIKTGYIEGEDMILDIILQDYNVSHDVQ